MVSRFYEGLATQKPVVEDANPSRGLFMDWLLQNKRDAMGRTGLINQMLTGEDQNYPRLPTGSASYDLPALMPSEMEYLAKRNLPPLPATPPIAQETSQRATLPSGMTSAPQKVPAQRGREMEVSEKTSIDDLMRRLDEHRTGTADRDRRMSWLNFASALANSKSPTILGGLAEGVSAVAPTIERQEAANRKSAEESLVDQIKLEQWKKQEQRADRSLDLQDKRLSQMLSRGSASGGMTPATAVQITKQYQKMAADPLTPPDVLAEAASLNDMAVTYLQSRMNGGAVAGAQAKKPIAGNVKFVGYE